MLICVFVGGLEWSEADKVLKANKHGHKEKAVAILNKYRDDTGVDLHKKFVKGCMSKGMTKEQSENTWDSLLVYSFNKGHAAGYCIVSAEEMFFKVYYPEIFWYAKVKYARNDKEKNEFCMSAATSGSVIFLPHVNYSQPLTSVRKVEGELAIQQGFTDLKGIGAKAGQFIYEERKRNGIFTSYDDFYDRCKGRVVNSKVLRILEEQGALEFSKKTYIKRVTMYNSSLYARGQRN